MGQMVKRKSFASQEPNVKETKMKKVARVAASASGSDEYSRTREILQMIQKGFVFSLDAQHRTSPQTRTLCRGVLRRYTNRPTVSWLWRWFACDLNLTRRRRSRLLAEGFLFFVFFFDVPPSPDETKKKKKKSRLVWLIFHSSFHLCCAVMT